LIAIAPAPIIAHTPPFPFKHFNPKLATDFAPLSDPRANVDKLPAGMTNPPATIVEAHAVANATSWHGPLSADAKGMQRMFFPPWLSDAQSFFDFSFEGQHGPFSIAND
jgi:hypothetical protein